MAAFGRGGGTSESPVPFVRLKWFCWDWLQLASAEYDSYKGERHGRLGGADEVEFTETFSVALENTQVLLSPRADVAWDEQLASASDDVRLLQRVTFKLAADLGTKDKQALPARRLLVSSKVTDLCLAVTTQQVRAREATARNH